MVQCCLQWRQPRVLVQSIGYLIGERIDDEDTFSSGPVVTWPPNSIRESAHGLALQLAVLGQCITSTWLFHRRCSYGSDALYDYKIFQLAVLGLCTSAMTILQIVLKPYQPHKAMFDNARHPSEVKWLIYFKNLFSPKVLFIKKRLGYTLLQSFLGLLIATTPKSLYYVYASVPVSQRGNPEMWNEDQDGLFELVGRMIAIPLVVAPVGLGCFGLLIKRFPDLGDAIIIVMAPFAALAFEILVFENLSQLIDGTFELPVLLSKPISNANYTSSSTWRHIWTFGQAWTNNSCPKAWKDPQADYLWWLA